jgi:glycosyltransferase involved in cell wall biosynthesis
MSAREPLVVAIFPGPTPYYTAILNRLAESVRLHVVYMARGARPNRGAVGWSDFDDVWGEPPQFRHSFHPSVGFRVGRADFHTRVSAGISRALARLDPGVVLVHSWGPLMAEPLVWARLRHRRTVMWTESGAKTGLLRDPVSMLLRRRLVDLVDAFVATGTLATEFIATLGADPRRVVNSCLPSALASALIAAGRRSHAQGAGPTRRYLFVGRLVELKRPLLLARAFLEALPSLDGSTLTFVGDGPLADDLAAIAARSGDAIRLAGRAEGAALVERYLDADILVLPSVREVWGLVVNEALAAGLYVVATSEVAAAVDLLDPHSGIVVEPDRPDALVAALRTAHGAGQSEAARQARAERVAGCTPEAFAADVCRAIELAARR